MKTCFQQIRWQIFVVTVLLIIFSPMQTRALEVETHRAINEKNAAKGSFLHQYLIDQLGLKDGVETEINKKWIIKWLGDGGVNEDNFLRYLNHFYNPLNNSGLLGNIPAKDWALRPVGNQYSDGQYSWFDARDYYLKALTFTNKATRENNFAETFRAIGQVMHMVHDMSVPAHTRDDAHPTISPVAKGDPYEKWAQRNINTADQVSGYSGYSNYTPFNNALFLIPQLFDTDQYNGGNPGITTSSGSIGLAEYTNANFLSAGTIFKNFTYPSYNPGVSIAENPQGEVLYLKKIGEGAKINYFARVGRFYKKLPVEYKPLELTVKDNKVHENYAQLLIPRAIGYSSQALSYFFRGHLEVEMGEGSLKVKNTSSETMTGGKFELYYDNASGVRTLVTSAGVSELLPGGDPQTIPFTPPPDGAESYMLVYRDGMLGNETNAVIGKFIPVELVIFTVSLDSNLCIPDESLTKSASFVWNPAANSLARAPLDNSDTDFQKWYQTKTIIGNPMFSSFAPDFSHPHKLAPELIDNSNMDYHAQTSNYKDLFPQTIYASVLLPDSPVAYAGIRTAMDKSDVIWQGYEYYMNPDPYELLCLPYVPGEYTNQWYADNWLYCGQKSETIANYVYEFFGIFGTLGTFKEERKYGSDEAYGIGYDDRLFIPAWKYSLHRDPAWSDNEWEVKRKEWYSDYLVGQYSGNIIADVCLIQFASNKYSLHNIFHSSNNPTIIWSQNSERTILVQGQALYVPMGTTGYDWVAKGRNNALETQIIAVINMAYSLNGIPGNEVRAASITIEIVK